MYHKICFEIFIKWRDSYSLTDLLRGYLSYERPLTNFVIQNISHNNWTAWPCTQTFTIQHFVFVFLAALANLCRRDSESRSRYYTISARERFFT